jgi:hypothetical protein
MTMPERRRLSTAERDVMKAITAGLAAGAATLAPIVAPVAHGDPTPDPTPGYTWECDTDSFGHTSCRAVPIPECGLSQDGRWIVPIPPGSNPGLMPAPCSAFGPGGVTDLVHAPYPATPPYFPPQPIQPMPTHVVSSTGLPRRRLTGRLTP